MRTVDIGQVVMATRTRRQADVLATGPYGWVGVVTAELDGVTIRVPVRLLRSATVEPPVYVQGTVTSDAIVAELVDATGLKVRRVHELNSTDPDPQERRRARVRAEGESVAARAMMRGMVPTPEVGATAKRVVDALLEAGWRPPCEEDDDLS